MKSALGLLAFLAAAPACSTRSDVKQPDDAASEGGCGQDGMVCDDNASDDGGIAAAEAKAPEASAAFRIAVVAHALGDSCLPQPLPLGAAGESACAIVLEGLGVDCTASGLAAATPGEVALLTRNQPLPAGSSGRLRQVAKESG